MKTFGCSKIWLASLLVGFTLFFIEGVQAQTKLQLSLGGVRGTYYAIGAQVAKYVNEHSKEIYITPITSGGSVENVKRINQKVAQLGMAPVEAMFQSWNGLPPYSQKIRNWRVIGVATKPMGPCIIALAKSNLKVLEDLKGKIVDIGAPGSGAAASFQKFLEHIGIYKAMEVRFLPHRDATTLLKDGKIDAMNRSGSHPVAAVTEISVQVPISLVDLGPALEKSDFLKVCPYFQKVIVKGGTYRGEDRDITTFGNAAYFLVDKDVSDHAVYEFARLAYNQDCIKLVGIAYKAHNMNRTNPLEGNIGPVHPGAVKFWKEIGVSIPEVLLK